MKKITQWALVLVTLGIVSSANAVVAQFEFSGVVELLADETGQLNGIVQIGDPFTVRYVFDTEGADQLPTDPIRAIYVGMSAQLILPTMEVSATAPELWVQDGAYADYLTFDEIGPQARFITFLDSVDGTTLTGDSFPWPSPGFSHGRIDVHWSTDPATKFSGTITAFPEPEVAMLVILGAPFVWGRRRVIF